MFSIAIKQALRLSSIRQALWLLSLFAIISIIAWGTTFWLIYNDMTDAVDQRLAARMEISVTTLDAGNPLPKPEAGQSAEIREVDWPDGFQHIDTEEEEPDFRYLVKTTNHGRIVLGEDIEQEEILRNIVAGGMQVTLLFTLLATIIAVLWLAQRGQRRLGVINSGLAKVGQGHLDTIIKLEGNDDLSLLAEQINVTTKLLDNAMTQMRVQSSNIAHDLKTPLARLRAQLETRLSSLTKTGQAVRAEDLQDALEQIDDINSIFDALLRLSYIENGMGKAAFKTLTLSEVAHQIMEIYEPVVADDGHRIVLEILNTEQILGDYNLLIQLVANLIQNALRYGPVGQTIMLRIDGATLSVTDQGGGIPAQERQSVLQPLYQVENVRQGSGHGLGLAMVNAICDLHNASLLLDDGPDGRGLKVEVQFPNYTIL
ncbi:MAG: HAMP domain-containing sensor histidine kinase [Pseudomonadota bacterium]